MICGHAEKSGKPQSRSGSFLGLVVKRQTLELDDKGSNPHSAASLWSDWGSYTIIIKPCFFIPEMGESYFQSTSVLVRLELKKPRVRAPSMLDLFLL